MQIIIYVYLRRVATIRLTMTLSQANSNLEISLHRQPPSSNLQSNSRTNLKLPIALFTLTRNKTGSNRLISTDNNRAQINSTGNFWQISNLWPNIPTTKSCRWWTWVGKVRTVQRHDMLWLGVRANSECSKYLKYPPLKVSSKLRPTWNMWCQAGKRSTTMWSGSSGIRWLSTKIWF